MTDETQEHQIEGDQVEADEAPEVEAQPEATAQPAPRDWTDEDEQEARLFGWKAPEEWQGDKPPGYIDRPTDFLERVQRSRIFKAMQEKLKDVDTTKQKLEAMNERALQMQREQYESRMRAITQQQRRAVDEADGERFDALEKQRQELAKQEPREQQAPEQQQPDPEVIAYRASPEGAWLGDQFLGQAAVELINRTPGALYLSGLEQAALAKRELSRLYPDRFPQAQARPVPRNTVDAGGLAGGAGRQAGAFAKLPAEAKAQYARFVKEGLYKDNPADKEEFANEYNAA